MNPSLSTAFGYIRVSTHMQEELSPDAQKREIQRWADAHKIQILRWFQDTGISGKKASNRSDFQQMISLAKEAAHPDYILTWKFSRFARNQEESIVYKSLLRKNNVQVISVSEPLPDGPFSSLIERIIEWMDEYYSIRLSGEVRRGMMEKALSGGYQSPPPLGYQKPPGTLIPQVYEPEAAIYRQIKEYALAGRSPTSIARLLNSQGLHTKRGHAFDSRSIRYILQNPFYAGKVRWTPGVSSGGQAESIASMSSDPPQTSVILSDGRHTPLCTAAEWKMLCALFPAKNDNWRRSASACPHYLCGGLLRCPYCGASMSYTKGRSSSNGRRYPYFCCWRYSKGLHEKGGHISASRCEKSLMDSLWELASFLPETTVYVPTGRTASPPYQSEIKRLDARLHRAREAYLAGVDSLTEYEKQKNILERERETLLQQSKSSTEPASGPLTAKQLLEKLSSSADPLFLRDALRQILRYMKYDKETSEFHFYYKEPTNIS